MQLVDFIIQIIGLIFLACALYAFFERLIELIRQKLADDMRKAYQARKAAVERQARQRL